MSVAKLPQGPGGSPDNGPIRGLTVKPNNRRVKTYWMGIVLALVCWIGIFQHIGFILPLASTAAIYDSAVPSLGSDRKTDYGLAWSNIEPSTILKWEQCYGGQYDCARLDVPMDWLDPSSDRVVIAIIRLNATEQSDYRGPVFFNPGGPGGSGIWSMLDHGSLVQKIVGQNHDIISFDPRGVGASTPRINCWPTDQERTFWGLTGIGVSDSHPGMIYDEYYRAFATSQLCEATMAKSKILKHISTASHVRDMLEILHQLGESRLKYWGFSYGTVIAGTFAAMYPEKVERIVSDGNVDLREWYTHVHTNFPRDADKALQAFYDLCAAVGPSKCAFHSPLPTDIEQRLHQLLERLRKNPIIIPAKTSPTEEGPEMPEIVTYSKVRRLISTVLYRPLYTFPNFARVLDALDRGDGLPYYQMAEAGMPPLSSFCYARPVEPGGSLAGVTESTADAFPAISCADSEEWTGGVEDFVKVADEIRNISWAVGALYTNLRAQCVGRKIRSNYRFAGPFEAKTNFPMLFVANIADNITPLISARNNSLGFEGSVVLVQNSYGHTSLSAPSTCTAKHIRRYFQEGVLPGPDTACEADYAPFDTLDPPFAELSDRRGIEAGDEELSNAIRQLSVKASAKLGKWPF